MGKKYNKYRFDYDNSLCFVITDKGEEIVIDLEDYEKIKDYYWSVTTDLYAKTNYKNKHTIQMHRVVMGVKDRNIFIDHKTSFGSIPKTLNNTKSNLRFADVSKNSINRKTASNNTSGTPGVSYDKSRDKWRAYIKINQKYRTLGRFHDKEDAIKTRLKAEEKYFGEWSYTKSNCV